jgi:hypothetical protein
MAERQTIKPNRKRDDHASSRTIFGQKATRFQGEEPHAETEAAQETAQSFTDLFENERETTKDGTSEEDGYDITALHSITHGWTHHVYNEDSDAQRSEERR